MGFIRSLFCLPKHKSDEPGVKGEGAGYYKPAKRRARKSKKNPVLYPTTQPNAPMGDGLTTTDIALATEGVVPSDLANDGMTNVDSGDSESGIAVGNARAGAMPGGNADAGF